MKNISLLKKKLFFLRAGLIKKIVDSSLCMASSKNDPKNLLSRLKCIL